MSTRYLLIDKKPRCIDCGKEADYYLRRNMFFYSYNSCLCFKCLRQHLKRCRVSIYREKGNPKDVRMIIHRRYSHITNKEVK